MDYVNVACNIHDETINFLSRLSARYSRLFAEKTAMIAGNIMDEAATAEGIYPNNEASVAQRRAHLIEARANLVALDARLLRIYNILRKNPKGAFAKGNDKGDDRKQFTTDDALRILENMAESIGLMIDREDKLLDGIMVDDQRRLKGRK